VLTLVGTGGAGVDVVVGVGDAVEDGVRVGVGVVVDIVDDELGIGIGAEEDPGGETPPPHVPKALWHPEPQYEAPLPQK
jgi:hypothetical protein